MKGLKKFFSKLVCVVVVFSAVVGGSERAWGVVSFNQQKALVGEALNEFLEPNQAQSTLQVLQQMGMIQASYTILMSNAGGFIDFLFRLGAIANTSIGGVSYPTESGNQDVPTGASSAVAIGGD